VAADFRLVTSARLNDIFFPVSPRARRRCGSFFENSLLNAGGAVPAATLKVLSSSKIAARVSADTRATPAFSSNVPPQHGMKNSHEILKLVQFQTSSKPFDTETVTALALEFLPSA